MKDKSTKFISLKIEGNHNVQVSGDYIKTDKIVRKTEVHYDKDEHITDAQAKEIRDRIQKIAESKSIESKYSYGKAYKALYDKYDITKYSLLPKDKYEDAIKWLDKQIVINRPKLKQVNNEQYRKDMYKSIHARANQIGINVHDFASAALELKSTVTSLTELSDAKLKKLYTKLFNAKIK